MRLSDPKGKSTLVAKTIEILNAAPVAAFTASPASPLADEPVTFTSQSTDPDGGTLDITQAWDLDGDGAFDDADGPIARATFTPGEHVVRLRVTDANGAVTVAEQRVVAVAASPPGGLTAWPVETANGASPLLLHCAQPAGSVPAGVWSKCSVTPGSVTPKSSKVTVPA